ncbi:heme NO-binding domain-containing protein [uncultured Shimia sp.]|uniref:heme NO-binding domain-containing protein n=1 Tax=uncultured Shimia sp. TaxID=573152 RepID=UPI0026133583|nr:heme NO-binding domain-containing protein [uncultured Shimia sp.]
MHGLINRAVQCFIRDSYGRERWIEIATLAELGFSDFEAMLHYDDALTWDVLDAAALSLGVPRETVLEDIGTYLVSHPNVEALRRLLHICASAIFLCALNY